MTRPPPAPAADPAPDPAPHPAPDPDPRDPLGIPPESGGDSQRITGAVGEGGGGEGGGGRGGRRRAGQGRPRGDEGNAALEFVAVSVILLVPLLYLLVAVFSVQRASFGATQAAREAGRAFATADSTGEGLRRARAAVALALADQGVTAPPVLAAVAAGAGCDGATGTAGARLTAGSRFTVCVTVAVPLPFADRGLLRSAVHATVRVGASALVVVDSYRAEEAAP